MKKKFILSIILLFIICGIISIFIIGNSSSYTRSYSNYNPEAAIAYSYKYIYDRNPSYPNFEKNCVCYVSQCLIAGGLEIDEKKIEPLSRNKTVNTNKKWYSYSYENDPYKPIYYCFSASFTSARYFVPYWTKIANVPHNILENTEANRECIRNNVKPGDVLILYSDNSTHAALIVKIDEKDIYYNSNTNNRMEYPLSFVDTNVYYKIAYLNFVS